MQSNQDLINEARILLKCPEIDPVVAKKLAKELKNRSLFSYAAELFMRLLDIANTKNERDNFRQNLAVCLYKDPDLPAATKFRLAEEYLSKVGDGDLTQIQDSEVLALMGAIYKRKWQYDSQFKHLQFSRYYYKKGYEVWRSKTGDTYLPDVDYDAGYSAINYAFVLDMLSVVRIDETVELKDEEVPDAKSWLETAHSVRMEIITYLNGDELYKKHQKGENYQSWAYATLGEAYFALKQYPEARYYYNLYQQTKRSPWEIETTGKQLIALAEMEMQIISKAGDKASMFASEMMYDKNDIVEALQNCLGELYPSEDGHDIPATILNGKTGLAFSGGGFRASLFHIGVLAKLAELDVLRNVEVISCVSGGSIVGAYYYLLLRQKLESKPETGINKLSRQDYIDIVAYMVEHFRKDVQKNLRIRILSSWWYNLRIFFDADYTRTHRLAELYEKHLYQKLVNDPEVAPNAPIYMQNIKIKPFGYGAAFNPKADNWKRSHKVPMLVLNATSMNTGHNWQFTASWMGEPPANIQPDVDSKMRLRRMWYSEAPEPYKNKVRLGQAVGSSSAVPGLFEPLLMRGLYKGIDLRLCDGGVHDNQGVSSLLEQECRIMLVSDASGQLAAEMDAGAGVAGSAVRSDSILQERVRESQLLDLSARKSSAQLNGLMFVHLKKELNENPKQWIGCNDPTRNVWLTLENDANKDMTSYQILKDVQKGVALLRTDLDAFSDSEAFALMYSGYQQTDYTFRQQKLSALFPREENEEATSPDWEFLKIGPWMRDNSIKRGLMKRLKNGANVPLKVFRINWAYAALGMLMAALPLIAIGYLFVRNIDETLYFSVSVKAIGIFVILFLADYFVSSVIGKLYNWQSTIFKKIFIALGAVLIALVSQFYLLIFNRVYLRNGAVENLEREDKMRKFVKKLAGFFK